MENSEDLRQMFAIRVDPEFKGQPESLVSTVVPRPRIRPGEVLIKVAATGVNRADVMQRQGSYPPPPGASDILGLEVSGHVVEIGPGGSGVSIGDEVCALLSGGGYAEYVAVPVGQVLPVPRGLSLLEAASLPEAVSTVWSNLVIEARLQQNETVLIHGGSSGIGTMAIQVAKGLGARVIVTAGSADKLTACAELGADVLINYKEEDFLDQVKLATKGHGVDVVLDVVGGAYLDRNTEALAVDGRLVVIGLLGGSKGQLDLGVLLRKRGRVLVTSLRSRSVKDKSDIVAQVRDHLWPRFDADHPHRIRAIIQTRYPLEDAAKAHRELEASEHIGKILLDVSL